MVLINFMTAHYDTYDYSSYWEKRDYEHESEIIALKALLLKINKVDSILDIGAGYGRLTQTYLHRGKKIILTDPSINNLSLAKNKFKDNKKIKYIQSKVETLKDKIKSKSIDLAIMIRVIHHLEKPEEVFRIINKLIKPGGYFILEFANKSHGKAVFKELFKGNLTFLLDIFPKDMRSSRSIKKKTIPFTNYHPDSIIKMLSDSGFKIIDKRSVSNIRSTKIKNSISLSSLLKIEELLQKPLSYINFGPSIFILARKKSS